VRLEQEVLACQDRFAVAIACGLILLIVASDEYWAHSGAPETFSADQASLCTAVKETLLVKSQASVQRSRGRQSQVPATQHQVNHLMHQVN
jgi:hypothetical protein